MVPWIVKGLHTWVRTRNGANKSILPRRFEDQLGVEYAT
jgi:hypothetical protein